MKERPILFSTPMVRAILEGRKSQTRRIVKPSNGLQRTWLTQDLINEVPHGELINGGWQMHHPYAGQRINNIDISYDSPLGWVKCPYGQIGDILWVRETWRPTMFSMPIGWPYDYRATAKEDGCPEEGPWKPSIFMPKEVSRIKLKVTDIRVERVQDITEEDAIAEGIEKIEGKVIGYPFGVSFNYSNGIGNYSTPKEAYMALWEKINGKDSWKSNPWVWVIEFERI